MLKHTAKALVCALSLTVAGIVQAADPIVIKFSHVVAEHTPKGQGALQLPADLAVGAEEKDPVHAYCLPTHSR